MHVISDHYSDPHPTVLVRVIGMLARGDVDDAREMLHREWQSHGSTWTKELHASPGLAAGRLAAYERAHGLPACSECGSSEPPVLFLHDTTGLLDDRDEYVDGTAPSWHGRPEISAEITCAGCASCTGTFPGGNAEEAVKGARRWWMECHAAHPVSDAPGREG